MTSAGVALAILRILAAALGGIAVSPLGNLAVTLAGSALGFALPGYLRNTLRRHRRRRIRAAVGPALALIARSAESQPHPYQVLVETATHLLPPLGAEIQRALAEHRAGASLNRALLNMALRLEGDFYLLQVAELTGVAIRRGGGLSAPVNRLLQRYWMAEELKAESAVEMFGYSGLLAGLFLLSLLPVPLALLAGGPPAEFILHAPVGRWLVGWSVWSGLLVASAPAWFASEEG